MFGPGLTVVHDASRQFRPFGEFPHTLASTTHSRPSKAIRSPIPTQEPRSLARIPIKEYEVAQDQDSPAIVEVT
jgi:hypothetical protein